MAALLRREPELGIVCLVLHRRTFVTFCHNRGADKETRKGGDKENRCHCFFCLPLSPSPCLPLFFMSRQIYISGKFVPQEDAKISVFDHGLLYGDGVFEGLRSYGGKVFRLREHIVRLYESARAIWLEIPMTQDAMCEAVKEAVRVNKIDDG